MANEPSNAELHAILTDLVQRIATLETSHATPPPITTDHDEAMESDRDPHVTEQAPTTVLTPYPEFLAALPSMGNDFFRTVMDDDTRRAFLHECPRNTARQYQPPPLNDIDVSERAKHADRQLRAIQYRLSGITRPIDLFVHDVVHTGQVSTNTALRFANTIHALLSDVASVVTQARSDNICRDTGLAVAPSVILDTNATRPSHQLQGTVGYPTCNTTSRPPGEGHSPVLRQHNNNRIRQQVRRDEIPIADTTCDRYLERMSEHQHSVTTHVHPIPAQSRGPTISATSLPTGMEHRAIVLPETQCDVGASSPGLLRHSTQYQATTLHELAMGRSSCRDQCDASFVDSLAAGVSLSTLELASASPSESATRQSTSNSHHPPVAECHMVPDTTPAECPSTLSCPSVSRVGSARSRPEPLDEESTLAFDRMAHKRRRLMDSGLNSDATTVLLDPAHHVHRNNQYQPIQRRYIQWAQNHQVDPFVADPVHLVNFLAYGRVHCNWSAGTCSNYRSAILDLYEDKSIFTNNTTYHDFFTAVNNQTIRSFDRPLYDISPVIQHILHQGDNMSMRPIDLTRKLCFLLAITGFLRPSDIERIDDARTTIDDTGLRIVIVKPKEKRKSQPIEKVIHIHRHSNNLLCPVQTYVHYRQRFCGTPCVRAYPVANGPRPIVHRLIRQVHKNTFPTGAERISNHIKALLELIPRPPGTKTPKARALGSTSAVEAGASIDDVLVHGSWLSSSVFDTFYRMSRLTATDFTHLTLPTAPDDSLDTQSGSVTPAEE